MPTITHDDNKTFTLPTIFHNIEQEFRSKTRVRALTRDPTRPGPKLLTRWPTDPWPSSISDWSYKDVQCHHQQTNTKFFFTGWTPFLSPNQQCWSTEGKSVINNCHTIIGNEQHSSNCPQTTILARQYGHINRRDAALVFCTKMA